MFEEVTKKGCKPFNWLVEGMIYPVKLLAGQYVDQIRQVDAPNTPLMGRPSALHEFFEEFVKPYDSTQWDSNQVDGGGDSSEVCTVNDGVGGELTLTTNDAEDDAEQRTYATQSFKLQSDKSFWFEARVKASAATEIDMMVGLINSEDLTGVSDNLPATGVVFKKDDGDTNIDANSSDAGSHHTEDNVATLDSDYHRYGFRWNASTGLIEMYVDGSKVCSISEHLAASILTPSIMVKAGDGNARTLTVDYIRVVQER